MAFALSSNITKAIGRYQLLLEKFPQSHMARRAANEIGLLYYQDDKYPEAIAAYKRVIQNYPGSEEAQMAHRDLKSSYIDLNQVDEYAAFALVIPGGANFDVNERDSLTYVAAERVYMRGEATEARNSFVRYLQTFPEGAFSLNAHYYIGLMDYQEKNFEGASAHLGKVLEYPNNKYSEEALVMSADMAYQGKEYARALEFYKQLKAKASTPENLRMAATGMLRSAALSGMGEEVILVATEIVKDAKVAPELVNEARYYRSKALVEANRVQNALEDWEALAKDTRNVYGAEAKYRLAQHLYDAGRLNEVEEEVFEFVDASTPHTYWLARSFILLSDTYVKLDRKLEARQYLLSLEQNYQADDDIAEMIKSRLEKMKDEQQTVTE